MIMHLLGTADYRGTNCTLPSLYSNLWPHKKWPHLEQVERIFITRVPKDGSFPPWAILPCEKEPSSPSLTTTVDTEQNQAKRNEPHQIIDGDQVQHPPRHVAVMNAPGHADRAERF